MPTPKKAAKATVVKPVAAPAADASNDPAAQVAPAEKSVKTAKAPPATQAAKPRKPKLVRDSFTIPKPEYVVIDELKLRASKLGQPAKKSEVLRAGLKVLAAMGDEALLASLAAVPRIKTGRPAKT